MKELRNWIDHAPIWQLIVGLGAFGLAAFAVVVIFFHVFFGLPVSTVSNVPLFAPTTPASPVPTTHYPRPLHARTVPPPWVTPEPPPAPPPAAPPPPVVRHRHHHHHDHDHHKPPHPTPDPPPTVTTTPTTQIPTPPQSSGP